MRFDYLLSLLHNMKRAFRLGGLSLTKVGALELQEKVSFEVVEMVSSIK